MNTHLTKKDVGTPSGDQEYQFFVRDLSTCCKHVVNEIPNKYPFPYSKLRLVAPSTVLRPSSNMSKIPHYPQAPMITNKPQTRIPTMKQFPRNVLITNQGNNFNNSLPFHQQEIVDFDQPSNHITVQATCVPSLTVNTGTQYIHNVYSDTNPVAVQPSFLTNTVATTGLSSPEPLTFCNANVSVASQDKAKDDIQTLNHSLNFNSQALCTDLNCDLQTVCANVNCSPQTVCTNAGSANVGPFLPNLSNSRLSSTQSTSDSCTSAATVETTTRSESKSRITSYSDQNTTCFQSTTDIDPDKNCIIIPDEKIHPTCISNEKTALSEHYKLREQILRRPMPKSKKESLLRSISMNTSIETMKEQLQSSLISAKPQGKESNTNLLNSEKEEASKSLNTNTNNINENLEEPILKSIIQTATERLLKIHENQNHCLDSNKSRPNLITNVDCNENNNNGTEILPKIKVRNIEELQEVKQVTRREVESEKNLNPNLVTFEPIPNKSNIQSKDVDVTGLKQAIIEASRTLVTTQKKFKELAKVISKNVTFRTEKASELVNQFQEILKHCQNQMDTIDKNVKSQYGELKTGNNKPAVTNSSTSSSLKTTNCRTAIKEKYLTSHEKTVNVKEVLKSIMHKRENKSSYSDKNDKAKAEVNQCRSLPLAVGNLECNKSGSSTISNSLILSDDDCEILDNQNQQDIPLVSQGEVVDVSLLKRKRDLVDFNPLGKKLILGSPEVTQEDLQQINHIEGLEPNQDKCLITQTSFRQQLYLKNSKKRRDVWSYKSRKRPQKKGHFSKKGVKRSPNSLKWKETDDINFFRPRPQSQYIEERLRRREKKIQRPLRSSERNHASTAEYAARLFPSEKGVPPAIAVKPCSVFITKLDPRIVELLQKKSWSCPNLLPGHEEYLC